MGPGPKSVRRMMVFWRGTCDDVDAGNEDGDHREAKEPRMGLQFDSKARVLLARHRPGQVVLVTVVWSYAMPIGGLTAEWASEALAARDPDLVRLDLAGDLSVPVYVHRRLDAYLRWNTLRVMGRMLGPWTRFALDNPSELWRHLQLWEHAHPAQRAPRPLSTALDPVA